MNSSRKNFLSILVTQLLLFDVCVDAWLIITKIGKFLKYIGIALFYYYI